MEGVVFHATPSWIWAILCLTLIDTRDTLHRNMPKSILYIIYCLVGAAGLVAMYSLLNAGNPNSLLRVFFPDPNTDVYIAAISSLIVFILGFVIFFNRDSQGFRHLIELNGDKIRQLRKEGQPDEAIADAILAAMGSTSGYRHNLAHKKLVIYLSQYR